VRVWARDLLAEPATGLVLLALVCLAVGFYRPLARRLGWWPWPTLGTLLALAAVGTLTLMPAPHQTALHNAHALADCTRSLTDVPGLWRGLISTTQRGERVGNILMFAPLTFFATLASRRPVLIVMAGVLLPVPIELAQAIMDTGRTCVGYDWVNNAVGALLGALAALPLIASARQGDGDEAGDGRIGAG
jgi:VanZ family protein